MKIFASLAPIIIGIILHGCIFDVLCTSLAEHKGYKKKYIAIGFFLGIIGLMYAGFLPSISVSNTPTQKQIEFDDDF